MIRLERRPEVSRSMNYLSPVLALVLTLISGTILFSLMGVSPLDALYTFFVEFCQQELKISKIPQVIG